MLEQDLLAGAGHMGPGHTEHGIWTHYMDANHSANIKQNGVTNHCTNNMESLALGNSLAYQCKVKKVHFKDISCPTIDLRALVEHMGFDIYTESDVPSVINTNAGSNKVDISE
jgi:hypothetical protein